MKQTLNLLLKLPDPTDLVLVEDFNENFTKIDTEIAKITDEETGAEAKLNQHAADKNNPHGVTKDQVGLGNLQNYEIATQADAETGTSTDKYMTPERTRQAFEKNIVTISQSVTEVDERVTQHLDETAKKTTANITYYISTTGNDSNDGLTSGTALKTIQAAINKLPQIVNHSIIINISQGTYSEAVEIIGFIGKGSITVTGGADNVAAANYKVTSIKVRYNNVIININGIQADTVTDHAYLISHNGILVSLTNVVCTAATTTYSAITIWDTSQVRVRNSILSNRFAGISTQNSRVFSWDNSGTGNTYGLDAVYASTIGKNGTQPSGTTAERTVSGGVIR